MKKYRLSVAISFVVLSLSACGLIFPAAPTPTIAPTFTPIIMPTEIPLPTAAPVIEPTATATPEPTPTPSTITMLDAQVVFDNYALRSGPGRLFERIALYPTGESVSIIGREFTDNWVLVITSDNRSGWMNVVGLDYVGGLASIPVFDVPHAVVVHGHVYLQMQVPAEGIGVSIAPSDNDLSESSDTSTTNAAGEWAIYLPIVTYGEWTVGPNSYNCEGSNAVTATGDDECELMGKLPDGQTISLPLDRDVAIEFLILPLNP
jgi:hypothetical protein